MSIAGGMIPACPELLIPFITTTDRRTAPVEVSIWPHSDNHRGHNRVKESHVPAQNPPKACNTANSHKSRPHLGKG